jgi:adenine-specific DNA-methyltransferase
MKSLLDLLPGIVAEGKREAERVMERAESNYRLGLQTRELVIPSKDSNWKDLFGKANREVTGSADPSRLVYGDNLLAMAALLAGIEHISSLRGKIDLIYIDPPFDSKADYRSVIAHVAGQWRSQANAAAPLMSARTAWRAVVPFRRAVPVTDR